MKKNVDEWIERVVRIFGNDANKLIEIESK